MVARLFLFSNQIEMKKTNTQSVILLFAFILLPFVAHAKIFMGTVNLKVGDSKQLFAEPSTYYTVTGSWSRTGGTAFYISARSQRSCTITAIKSGTATLEWMGLIDARWAEMYWTVNVTEDGGSQPGGSNIFYVNDYGKWGDITIKYGETKTLSHKFPSSVMNNRVSWEWCIRLGANAEHLLDDGSVKITSQSVNNCTIKGVGTNLHLPTRLYYYVQTGTYNGSKVYALGYYDITVDYAGKVTTSSNLPSGTYEEGTKVYLTPSVSGGDIYYTTDGSEPDWSSTLYTHEGITLSKSMTLKARSYADGYSSEIVNSWTYTVVNTGIEINATNFPDEYFRNYLLEQSYGKDGVISESEIKSITYVNVSGGLVNPGKIKSLKGIEYFTALTRIHCSNNQLTALDVSKNTALKSIQCSKNQLTTLDVTKNTALTDLECAANQLTALDVSKNAALTKVRCGSNQLSTLDVSKNTALLFLNCWYSQLTALDVSRNTALTDLDCGQNQLTALDVSKNTALTVLKCDNNQLTSLDVSKNAVLEFLNCENNQLTSLGVTKNTALKILGCNFNQLTSLDVSKNTALSFMYCRSNQLTSLDVSKNTALETLDCSYNQLTSLDVSKNTALTELYLYLNQIKGVDVDNLIASLPVNKSDGVCCLYMVYNFTKAQVATVKAKGWTPLYWNGTEYVEYEGSDEASSIKGDVNGDGQVNGTDYVALTNIVLGKNAKTDAADVNGDGEVNGTDYVALVNIVLGRSQAPRRAATDAARLSIDPSFDIKAGESKALTINLTNPSDEITLVQFDLRLPDGLAWEGDVDIPGRTTWRKHSLEANATGGIIRFLLASNSNATLSGTEGGIITITVTADKDFSGGDIKLENILMVSPDEKETKQDTYTYTIGQTSPTPSASAVLAIEPFNIAAGGEAEMVIDLTNPSDEITLVQFDLRLPDGLSVKQTGGDYVYDITDRTTWRKHSLEANATGGIIRFLLASSSNATLSGTEGAIITITLKADNTYKGGTVKLENILLVTPDEKEIKPADLSYTIGSTGISSITMDAIDSNTPIYNLRGQRLAAPQKGINIIGGKKVIVK